MSALPSTPHPKPQRLTALDYDLLTLELASLAPPVFLFVVLIHLPELLLYLGLFAWIRTWGWFVDEHWLAPFCIAAYFYFKAPNVIARFLCARLSPLLPNLPIRPDPSPESLRTQNQSKPRYTPPDA